MVAVTAAIGTLAVRAARGAGALQRRGPSPSPLQPRAGCFSRSEVCGGGVCVWPSAGAPLPRLPPAVRRPCRYAGAGQRALEPRDAVEGADTRNRAGAEPANIFFGSSLRPPSRPLARKLKKKNTNPFSSPSSPVSANLIAKEDIVNLERGCVCCSLRSDLVDALKELERREAASGTAFDAVLLETTGVADPGPVVSF